MKKTFTKKEVVAFGNYLLSAQRTSSIANNPLFTGKKSFMERIEKVHDADLCNFNKLQKAASVVKN